jgi:hypothetical protein
MLFDRKLFIFWGGHQGRLPGESYLKGGYRRIKLKH